MRDRYRVSLGGGGKEEFGRKEEIRLRNLLGLSRVDNRCVSTAGHLQKVGGNDAEIGTEVRRRTHFHRETSFFKGYGRVMNEVK